MRKLTTLFLLLFLLGGYSTRAQSVVWQDHFAGCAKSITYDTDALAQGFPAGTWGPADNPSAGPSKVYIGQHALRFKVPMSANPYSLKGVHLGFAPGTKVVGSADNFRFNVYRIQGNSMSILGSKIFKLTDFSDIGKPFQVTNNFLDLSALNIKGLYSGDDIIFALETKTATSDDVINLYFTLPADDAECSKVPSNWVLDVKNADDHKSISSLPIGMNEFFGLDKGASKDDGKVGNPAIFPDVEITADTKNICAGQCADLGTSINGTAYKWRPTLGVSDPNSKSPKACPRRTTRYTVEVTTPGGIVEDTVDVIVDEVPIATIVPNGSTQFCEGLSVDLTIENPKSLPFNYQWFRDGFDLGLNTQTITVNQTGLYDVIITNGACVRRSMATYIYVIPGTDFEIDGWPYTCGAGYTDMEVKGGASSQEFTWEPTTNLTIVPGGRSARFKAPGGTTQTYTVTTVSLEGCSTSKEITLHSGTDTVYSAITGINNGQTICSNVGKYKIKVGPFRKFGTLTTFPTLPVGIVTEDPSDNRSFIINTELITVPLNNITFTWSGNFNGCNFTAITSGVNLMPAPKAALSGFRDLVCVEDNLPFDITGSPTGGTISITPPTIAADPVAPNVIRFTGKSATPGEYAIKYQVTQGTCTDTIVRRFAVILRNQPATISPANGTFCTSEGNIVLTGSPIGGQFSIPGVTLPPTFEGRLEFNPALIPFNGNDTTITVTYSGTASVCIMNTTTDIRIIRSDLILTNFPDDNLLCRTNDFEFTVRPTQVVLGGTIVGKGQAIELVDPPSGTYRFRGALAPAGKYIISFTLNSATCPPFSILREITISEPPGQVAILGIPPGPICSNRDPFTMTGVPTGGTFESELGAIAPGTSTYDPGLIPPQSIPPIGESFSDVIRYSGKVGGCNYFVTDTITLISAKNPIFGIQDSICSDTAAFEFTITPTGGKFEVDSHADAFTQINDSTWKIDPAKIGHINTVTITYTGKIGICDYKGVKKVTVDKPLTQDEIIINVDGNPELICSTGQPILLTGSPKEGKFRGLGVSYIGDDAYFDPNTPDVNNKLGIIEFTGRKGGCTFSKFDTLNVYKVGDELIGLSDTVCQGAIVPFIASPSGGTCELTYMGNTVLLDLQGIYYEFRPSDYIDPPLNPGETDLISVHYYGSLSNGCTYDITKDITITSDFTEASITGLKTDFCASEEDVVLTAFPLGGTYKLNGETNVPGLVDNKFSPGALAPGVYTLTYEGSAGSCGFRATQDVEIKAAPEAIIGTPDGTTYCVGNSVRLEANPTGNYRYQWFLNNEVLNGATSQNLTDSKGGYYQVEITDLATNCSDKSDSVFTNVIKSKLEWDNRPSETFTKGPSESHSGCNDDGYILATIKERFPGERFEFMIDGKGPYSSGMNFIEFYSLIDPSNPDFSISGGKYKITAVDASGCQIDTTLIVLSNCCEMPTDLVIANSEPDNGSFNLAWTGPQGVQGFEVQIKKANDTDFGPRIILDGTASTYFFKDLLAGETYCARIRTVCEADPFTGGEGDTIYTASKWDTLCVTLVNDCPTVFSDITISDVTASGARITWDPVPTVIGYLVEYTLTEGGTTESISTTSTSVEITGLEINTNYTVTVKSDCGAGNYSSGVSNFFSTLDACPSPTGLTVFDVLTKSATASWDAAPGANSYEVRYTNTSSGEAIVKSTQYPMYELEGLDCGTSYTVEIRSICSISSSSDWSGAEFFTTAPCCGSVTNLRNTDQTATTLTFEWDAISGGTSYSLTYKNTITQESKTIKVPTNKIILTSLGLNTNYEVTVITICGSDSSGAVTEVASTNDACPSPIEVRVLQTSPTTAEIEWLAPTGTTSFILEYEISGSGVTTAIPVTGTKFTISGLQKGTNYDVRVKTECMPGSESSSIQTDFTTCDACGEVTGVVISQVTSFSSMVTWTGGICGTTYQVRYRNASLVGGWQTRVTQSNSLILLSLEPNTEYEVQVRTVCGPSDVSSWSTSKFLRTLNGNTCGIPSNLIAINIQKDRATFVWNTVNNATSYDVYVREETETVYKFVEKSSVNNLVLGGLTSGTKYYVKVRANCSTISGDFTPEVFFATLSGKEFAIDHNSEFRVYPNPTRGDVTVSFTSDSEQMAEFNLIDVTGRVVFKHQTTVKVGDNELTLPISNNVSTGIYLLNFEINGNRQGIKLVVE